MTTEVADTPKLHDVLRGTIQSALRGLWVALPARVEAYDATKYKISALPLLMVEYVDEEGKRKSERLPVINDVPVMQPGTGNVGIELPIEIGDTVLLIFMSGSIDRWLVRGGIVDPEDPRRGNISDAVAIPGLRDFAHASTRSPANTIRFTGNEIRAGGNESLALQSDLLALRDHVNVLATGGTGSAPIPAPSVGTGTQVLKGS